MGHEPVNMWTVDQTRLLVREMVGCDLDAQ